MAFSWVFLFCFIFAFFFLTVLISLPAYDSVIFFSISALLLYLLMIVSRSKTLFFGIIHTGKEIEEKLRESERKNRIVVSNILDLFIVHDQGKIIYCNKVTEKTLGYAHKELFGRTIWDVIAPEDHEKIRETIKESIQKESVRYYSSLRAICKSGEIKYVYGRAVDVLEYGRRISFAFLTDLTEIRKAEHEIRKLSRAIEQSQTTIVITDDNAHITYANPSFERISGYSIQEAIGKNPSILKSGHHSNSFYAEMWETIKSGQTWRGEFKNKRKDGSMYWEEAIISPVFNESSDIENYVAVKQDITKRKETEAKLKEYSQQVEFDLMQRKESLKKAQMIQRKINTQNLPCLKTVNAAVFSMPSEELGGDFFNIFESNGRLILIIGDCEGHGIDSAMDSVLAKSICDRYLYLLDSLEPGLFLKEVNGNLIQYFEYERYLTLFCGVFDPYSNLFYYASANSEIPFLIRNGKISLLEDPQGMHIGFSKDQDFEKKIIPIQEGDMVFFYSDALREIILPDSTFLGHSGISEILTYLKKVNGHELRKLVDRIRAFSFRLPLEDDTTLVLFQHFQETRKSYELHSENEIQIIQEDMGRILAKYDYPDPEKILIAFEEMVTNSIVHGNKNNPAKNVKVEMQIDFYSVEIILEDEGNGFDPGVSPDSLNEDKLSQMLKEGDVDRFTHGRGIFLTKLYVDQVDYNQKGNQVRLLKKREVQQTLFYESEKEK